MKTDSQHIIEALAAGQEKVLDDLYVAHRQEFVAWSQNQFGCRKEDAVDVFQESLICLYENVMSRKLTTMTSAVKTYLFAIGKRMLITKLKREQKFTAPMTDEISRKAETWATHFEIEKTEEVEEIANRLNRLGPPCKELLTLFYYKNFSMESIANRMNYKNTDVAKTQKNRCIKKLRTQMVDY